MKKCLGALLLLLSVSSWAQVTTGTIAGNVTDGQGAAIAGAKITVTEISKGTSTVRQSDETGSYIVPFLIPGVYKVTVEKEGFKKAEQNEVTLAVNQQARIDIQLSVGNVAETIEVTAAAPLVSSSSAEVGQVIGQKAVQELPLNGRNFAQLVYLSAGVTPGQVGENLSGASTFNPRAASNFNPLGHRANANGWLIDGIDNNEYTFNTVIVQPSLESVREFKVLTGAFSAEFGRGAGVVSVSTRSGNNDYHGTAFWFHRNIVFDARGYFTNPNIPKPPFRRHQFGTAWSGPVRIPGLYNGTNRTFFFADYAGQREFRGQEFVNTVPTAGMRNGDFSQLVNRAGQAVPIFNPFSTRANPAGAGVIRDPFPGGVIPGSLIDPVGRNVAALYPTAN
ncbi:MAG: carboxypeptidase-like regulatory domain-containing protein, partial [Bryobacteraceae bacterium]|nr:carboxypeptidase-like regulatory domain-containing protein [Bryobacteraceae bacterium]